MSYFYEDGAPDGWINKNIKQVGIPRNKNKIWVCNPSGKSIMVNRDEIPEGFIKGRTYK